MPPDRTPHSPAIPHVCTDRPLAGGLVVPWMINLVHNGHPVLGVVDERRRRAALTHGLCQICGQPLHDRVRTVRRTPRPDLDEALAATLNLLDPPGHTSDG